MIISKLVTTQPRSLRPPLTVNIVSAMRRTENNRSCALDKQIKNNQNIMSLVLILVLRV